LEIVPVGRTTLYWMEKAGRFPGSTYISPNRRVWYEDEIAAWQNAVDEYDPNRGRGQRAAPPCFAQPVAGRARDAPNTLSRAGTGPNRWVSLI
jgi:prophage regulatory protein